MIPLLRSLNELMVITQPIEMNKNKSGRKNYKFLAKDGRQSQSDISNKNKDAIALPNIPKRTRRKWIRRKEAMLKFFDELDYNNQIQSSYELTLIEKQSNVNDREAA